VSAAEIQPDKEDVMRREAVFFACLGLSAFTCSFADPDPATPAAQPATSATAEAAAAAPAAATPAAAPKTAAAPEVDPAEKNALAMGYRPKMRNGEKVYCKSEPVLGSRTQTIESCESLAQLKQTTQASKDFTQHAQQNQQNPSGR
jgi:hypothetical protein